MSRILLGQAQTSRSRRRFDQDSGAPKSAAMTTIALDGIGQVSGGGSTRATSGAVRGTKTASIGLGTAGGTFDSVDGATAQS